MSNPPTLNYAAPPRKPRALIPAFVLLLIIGLLHAAIVLFFCAGLAFGFPFAAIDVFLLSFSAISAIAFISAAVGIFRRSYRWALIAFITTLLNGIALISCLGITAFVERFHLTPEFILGGIFFLLPFGLLIPLALFLLNLLRCFRQSL
jgi:hypothetical protein